MPKPINRNRDQQIIDLTLAKRERPIITTSQAKRYADQSFEAGRQAAFDILQSKLEPLHFVGKRLEMVAGMIDAQIPYTAIPQARKIASEALSKGAADLTATYELFLQYTRDISLELAGQIEAELSPRIAARIEGIQRLTSGQDDGAYLRDKVKERGGIWSDLANQAALSYIGGRPMGQTSWGIWIAQQGNERRKYDPKITYHEIAFQLRKQLENQSKLEPIEEEALGQLKKAKKPAEVVRAAMSTYNGG